MWTAVLHAAGEPMRLEETRLAEPRAGEMLVRDLAKSLGASHTVNTAGCDLEPAGRLPLDRLLGSEYRLEDINEAYARLPAESVGRGLIVMGELS